MTPCPPNPRRTRSPRLQARDACSGGGPLAPPPLRHGAPAPSSTTPGRTGPAPAAGQAVRAPFRAAASTSPTRTSRSPAPTCGSATSTASTPTTSRTRAEPKLLASIACPGGQGDVSVCGQPAVHVGRADARPRRLRDPGRRRHRQQGTVPRRADLRHLGHEEAAPGGRGPDLPRIPHPHAGARHARQVADLRVRLWHGQRAVRRGAGGLLEPRAREGRNTALFSIDVIEVPLAAPQTAKIVNRPRIFADDTGNIAGLWKGGDHGPNTQRTSQTNQCHDITVFPEVGLAAGACSGNGILMDISDPVHPKRLDHASDKNFAYWHSATFNNDGTKVLFTDEWGGGTRPRCRATDLPNWGADAIFDIVDTKLVFKGYYKMPAAQTETENCVAHNGSLIPVPGPRHHGAGLVPGRLVGLRLHRFGQPGRDRVFRPGTARSQKPDRRRLLVHLLVQRQHLRLGDFAGHRRVPAAAERVPVAERDRRGDAGAARGVQRAAAAEGHLAGLGGGGSRLRRSAEPREGDSTGAGARRGAGHGARRADALERSQRRARRSNSSPRLPRSSSRTPTPPTVPTRSA